MKDKICVCTYIDNSLMEANTKNLDNWQESDQLAIHKAQTENKSRECQGRGLEPGTIRLQDQCPKHSATPSLISNTSSMLNFICSGRGIDKSRWDT